MKLIPVSDLQRKLDKFCQDFDTFGEAAAALGVTDAQLSMARAGKPAAPAIREHFKLERMVVYVEKNTVDEKFRVAQEGKGR